MTPSVIEALRKCARAQFRIAEGIASTQGREVADEMIAAWTELLVALEPERKESWSGKIFVTGKPKKKKAH
jgi:hypothetical protein